MRKREGRDASVESFGAKRIRLRLAWDGAAAFRFHTQTLSVNRVVVLATVRIRDHV